MQSATTYKRRWAITKNFGLLWNLFNHIVVKGYEMVNIGKVKAHVSDAMVEDNEYTKEEKDGNGGGDEAADIGASIMHPEEAVFGKLYSRSYWRYHKLMAKIHNFRMKMRTIMKKERAKHLQNWIKFEKFPELAPRAGSHQASRHVVLFVWC